MHVANKRRKHARSFGPLVEKCERLLLLSADLAPAFVSGFIYEDLNSNGRRNATDSAVADELVGISGIDDQGGYVDSLAVTNADGSFSFGPLAPGSYHLTNYRASGKLSGDNTLGIVTSETGVTATRGMSDGEDTITDLVLAAGDIGSGYAFGEVASAIKGRVFVDTTGDGLNPYEDAPQSGVKIELFRDVNANGKVDAADGAAVASTYSEVGTGAYRFLNPGNGRFLVREKVPANFVRTAPLFSDANVVNVCDCGIAHGGVDFANFAKPNKSAISHVSYTVSGQAGTRTVTDLRGNVDQKDEVTVTFTVKPGFTSELSLVSYTAPGKAFNANNASQQEVFRVDTGTFAPGIHTLHVTVPDSYFQVDFVAGSVINRFGPANSNIFFTPQGRLFSADNDGTRLAGFSSLSGFVYNDANHNGIRDSGEDGIADVTIELSGFDYHGAFVELYATTGSDGLYRFTELIGSDAFGYAVRELPAQAALSGTLDGLESAGTSGGTAGDDAISSIVLNVNANATGYNFGEVLWA